MLLYKGIRDFNEINEIQLIWSELFLLVRVKGFGRKKITLVNCYFHHIIQDYTLNMI